MLKINVAKLQEMIIERIEETLIQNIKYECQCSFNRDGFRNSTINCENRELTYATILDYSDKEGSETASVVAGRIVGQVPFSIAVGGTHLTVTNACTDCERLIRSTKAGSQMLSPAIGSGLFVGGFAAAIFIIVTLMIIVYVYNNHIVYQARSSLLYIVQTKRKGLALVIVT